MWCILVYAIIFFFVCNPLIFLFYIIFIWQLGRSTHWTSYPVLSATILYEQLPRTQKFIKCYLNQVISIPYSTVATKRDLDKKFIKLIHQFCFVFFFLCWNYWVTWFDPFFFIYFIVYMLTILSQSAIVVVVVGAKPRLSIYKLITMEADILNPID